MKKIYATYLKRIIAFFAIILCFTFITSVSNADDVIKTPTEAEKTFSGNMPANDISGPTGMMPQYFKNTSSRDIKLEGNRLSWRTDNWSATMSGAVIYCGGHGKAVRYGNYEREEHMIYKSSTGKQIVIQGYPINVNINTTWNTGDDLKTIIAITKDRVEEYAKKQNKKKWTSTGWKKDAPGETDANYNISYVITGNPDMDALTYIITNNNEVFYPNGGGWSIDTMLEVVQNGANYVMNNIFTQLGAHMKPVHYSSDVDGELRTSSITAVEGPEVVVMETSPGQNNRYTVGNTTSYTNTKESFIFTSSNEAYGDILGEQYSLNDMQTAYWKVLQESGGPNPEDDNRATTNGLELYDKSNNYDAFVKEIENGYNATIDAKNAQVIADRKNEEYIIGPYVLTYPEYEDISYIKSLDLNEEDKLVFDESHSGLELILDGKGIIGSNGQKKEYPKSGQKFFIKFSAKDANYPKEVTLNAKFEYISKSEATATVLNAKANIYKYYGHVETSGKYAMKSGKIIFTINWPEVKTTGGTKHIKQSCSGTCSRHSNTDPITGEEYGCSCSDCDCDGYDETYYYNSLNEYHPTITWYQPYIQMGEDPESEGEGQPLQVITNATVTISGNGGTIDYQTAESGKREYTVYKTSEKVDLTMELGGFVWEEQDGGKESLSDGVFGGNEKRVGNVEVLIECVSGNDKSQTTKTLDKDRNGGKKPYDKKGSYVFKDLNPMFTYKLTFTYNGMYYQPTTWSASSTWKNANWEKNSNAKDLQNERESFNIKFEKIGAANANYVGSAGANRSYTKDELLAGGVIDEFGNLINDNGNMGQYVKDCQMKAYTVDVYPYPDKFVVNKQDKLTDSEYALKQQQFKLAYVSAFKANPPDDLYDKAYYINLGLDQREESDLAIKKDVDHVTLEINGQTHKYTYDTLENRGSSDDDWEINVRVSDGYYNTAYTRELYKSDYLYKASNYGENPAQYGKTKDDELKIFITYKIMVRNQSLSIRERVDELVDYYDQDLTYIDDRSYIQIKQSRNDAAQKGIYSVGASNSSKYSNTDSISGYDALYITGLGNLGSGNSTYLAAGQTAYVYLTFEVKKDQKDGEDWIKLDEDAVSGRAIGVGKENIVEVNGYSTQYPSGAQVPNIGDVSFKPAGIVDKDSTSGNISEASISKDQTPDFNKFEDDTDKAPNIRIVLERDDNKNRVISGNVWEDERTETIEVTTTGDGIRDSKDKNLINGVTVQLVELMENGTEYVWREFGDNSVKTNGIGGENTIGKGSGTGTQNEETPIINAYDLVENYKFTEDHKGQYAFKSFMPGKYIVRFIYGDTVRTVLPQALTVEGIDKGLNEKSYNGQDYKSTTYQEGIKQGKTYTWREDSTWGNQEAGQEVLGKVLTEVSTFKQDASNNETVKLPQAGGNAITKEQQNGYLYDITESDKKQNVSDAKDIESRRVTVDKYSEKDITNYIAEVLSSHKVDYEYEDTYRKQLLQDLMQNTKMTAETGLMVIEVEYDTPATNGNKKDNSYKIQNVDLGLEERAKAQLIIDKEVTNVKLSLADGRILFDAKNTASNLLWKDHNGYSVGYEGNFMDPDKFGNLNNIREKNKNKFGLIQITMDEELMHGATVEITYKITVSNVGEVDYYNTYNGIITPDRGFYYTGNKTSTAQVVTTRADKVLDYVANNLQFSKEINKNWATIEKEEIKAEGLVNERLTDQVNKYNTIIVTNDLSKDLTPNLYVTKATASDKAVQKHAIEDSVDVPLILTQLITSENSSDDLSYRNIVEIVKTSSTLGRRMEFSVVGNQDPTHSPEELDSDIAEVVRILPPFGNAGKYITYIAIALAGVSIIVVGIIFIKKKVLKK